jgi:hypothetical protein
MSKESRALFNGSMPGEPKPPERVSLDDIDGRSANECIEAFQARVFTENYRMRRGGRAVSLADALITAAFDRE